MNINWKTRIKHPAFWVGIVGVIISPVLAYNGASLTDITTWDSVLDLIVSTVKNPYLIGSIVFAVLGFLGVSTDHTTAGLSDSERALSYDQPNKE